MDSYQTEELVGRGVPLVKPQVGQLVMSTAGRDTGCNYIVLRCLDDRYVLVVDGDKRVVAKPKKKNVQHLQVSEHTDRDLQARLLSGEEVSDDQVREVLERLTTSSEGG